MVLAYRKIHVGKQASVVATPVACPFSRTGERRTADDERPLSRKDFEQGLVGRIKDLMAKKIMNVAAKSLGLAGDLVRVYPGSDSPSLEGKPM